MLDDAAAAGHRAGPGELVSVVALVGRAWIDRACAVGVEAALGLPVALVCFVPLVLVYGSHIGPWDGLDEVPSMGWVRWLRLGVDWSFPIHAAICVMVGARAVRRVRSGSWPLPAATVLASLLMASQADLFVEKSAWWRMRPTNGAAIDDSAALVNAVSAWSLAVLAVAYLVPLGVVAVDGILHLTHARVPPAPAVRSLTRPDLGLAGAALAFAGWLVFAGFGPFGTALVAVSRRWSRTTTWLIVSVALMPSALLVLTLPLED